MFLKNRNAHFPRKTYGIYKETGNLMDIQFKKQIIETTCENNQVSLLSEKYFKVTITNIFRELKKPCFTK